MPSRTGRATTWQRSRVPVLAVTRAAASHIGIATADKQKGKDNSMTQLVLTLIFYVWLFGTLMLLFFIWRDAARHNQRMEQVVTDSVEKSAALAVKAAEAAIKAVEVAQGLASRKE